jgi:cytidylate kinase
MKHCSDQYTRKKETDMAKTYSIAIDGPAGAGKSTIARRLAKELGYYYVDTGAIYRTVAYFMDLLGVSPKDVDGVERYIDELTIEIEYDADGVQHMIMNGMDVSGDIRTQDISQKASLVSAHAVVRDVLLDMQRNVAKKHNVIMDGRDIGTVVLPKADVKIFLTAAAEVRAKRRYDELIAKGQKAELNTILKEIQQRDYQDSHREIAPLKQAKDAVLVDTSNLDIEGVVAAIREIVGKKIAL